MIVVDCGTALQPGVRHINTERKQKSLTRGRGSEMLSNYKRADWRVEGRTSRGKTRVMYNCRDRRKGSADLPSSVGWFGGSVDGDRM